MPPPPEALSPVHGGRSGPVHLGRSRCRHGAGRHSSGARRCDASAPPRPLRARADPTHRVVAHSAPPSSDARLKALCSLPHQGGPVYPQTGSQVRSKRHPQVKCLQTTRFMFYNPCEAAVWSRHTRDFHSQQGQQQPHAPSGNWFSAIQR